MMPSSGNGASPTALSRRHALKLPGLALSGMAAATGTALGQGADADLLRIGMEAGPTSIDPHFASATTDYAYARHYFQPLVEQDARQALQPALAKSWRIVDDETWEFDLDPAVRFHDGSPLTVDDIIFTMGRAGDVPNSTSSLSYYTRPIKSIVATGPHSLRLTTNGPRPLMATYLSRVVILSKRAAQGLTTADFNAGRGMIGTGPFRHVSWSPGNIAVMERYDGYNGRLADFRRVEMRPIGNAGSRVAALRSGDVDLIELVPTDQLPRLQADSRFATAEIPSNRLIFLIIDSGRAQSPFVRARDGSPIPNPMRDVRVRKALSMAINREALVARTLEGNGLATNDLAPPGYFGSSPELAAPQPFDLEGARRLLAEAGYPQGFAIQLNGPNDRYVRDEQIVQAIAQMWTRLGLLVSVETKPRAPYISESAALRYSAVLTGWSPNPEILGMLENLVMTADVPRGNGVGNRGLFSDARIDALIERARTTVDAETRERLSREAAQSAILEHQALIPLYFQTASWAMRRGLSYIARTDETMLAVDVRRS